VTDLAGKAGLGPERGARLELAVEEWVVNLCRHAFGKRAGRIEVVVRRGDGGLVVEIADDGPTFDPTAKPEPDVAAPLEERKPGGLGLLLMRRMTDQVLYRRDGERNVVTLRVDTGQS
jgi:anti-sigma regulatory factor (Ser/Thr protein kinase)